MLDLDPRDYDSRDEERHANTPSRGGRGSSGDHDRDHDWRQPDVRTRDRDDGDERSLGRGPETTGKGQTQRDETAIPIPAGPTATATATIENAIARSQLHSPATFSCHVDQNANWFMTAIANTPCAAPNPERSRPLVHSEWSPVVISATTMGALLIHGPATCDTCANKDWSRPRPCPDTAILR